ncbi:MAG: LytTR family transcriptional regulator [Parasporobacterium sp.]|nr:LytTR family transcriptional regulator [Parasporobacterium sp.]
MEVSHIPEGSCSKVITVSRCGETRFFPTGEIYYLESMRNLICVFGERGSFEFYGVLYKVERQIRSLGFFRISNSYIISMIHVRGVRSGYVELDNGKKISIGRKYRSDFKAALRESGILDLK